MDRLDRVARRLAREPRCAHEYGPLDLPGRAQEMCGKCHWVRFLPVGGLAERKEYRGKESLPS